MSCQCQAGVHFVTDRNGGSHQVAGCYNETGGDEFCEECLAECDEEKR